MLAVLSWFLHFTQYSVIIKVDDDVLLDPRRLDQVINLDEEEEEQEEEEDQEEEEEDGEDEDEVDEVEEVEAIRGIWGHVLHSSPVLRSGRYAVTEDQFPDTAYPDYVMGGFYATSRAAVAELLAQHGEPSSSPLLQLEDVAITGQLRERAGLGLVDKWQLILPWLGVKSRDIGEEEVSRAVVVYLQFVQGGEEGVEAMADWVWSKVWA